MHSNAITAAVVAANRAAYFKVPEGEQGPLVAEMDPSFKGSLTNDEVEGFWNYREAFHAQIANLDSYRDSPLLHERIRDLIDYSVTLFNHSPPIMFLNFLKHFKRRLTNDDMDNANYFAWALYLLNTIYITVDDIMDGAAIRRFKPAYYTENGSNVTWLRSLLVFNLLAEGLQHKFKNESFGFELSRLFAHYTTRGTVGQLLDLEVFRNNQYQFDMEFRLHHNECMTAPVISLSLEAAAIMTGRKIQTTELECTRELAFSICNLLRDNNDLVDSFPNRPHGKPLYSDICNGTCSWLSATAWQMANEEQRRILKENYGFDDNEKIAKVLQVYSDLDMETRFQLELPAKVEKIKTLVDDIPEDLAPKDILKEVFAFARKDLSGS